MAACRHEVRSGADGTVHTTIEADQSENLQGSHCFPVPPFRHSSFRDNSHCSPVRARSCLAKERSAYRIPAIWKSRLGLSQPPREGYAAMRVRAPLQAHPGKISCQVTVSSLASFRWISSLSLTKRRSRSSEAKAGSFDKPWPDGSPSSESVTSSRRRQEATPTRAALPAETKSNAAKRKGRRRLCRLPVNASRPKQAVRRGPRRTSGPDWAVSAAGQGRGLPLRS